MEKLKIEKIDLNSRSLDDFTGKEGANIVDNFEEQLRELFLIRNPVFRFQQDDGQAFEKFKQDYSQGADNRRLGSWFHFPWKEAVVHYLPENDYFELRTARNKNLITKQEQDKFYNSTVGIAGLSVGSHAALTIVMMGGSKNIKLADPDDISVSNLNRIRFGASSLWQNKALLVGREIAEMNPYANIFVFTEGITEGNMEEFFSGSSIKIDALIEETDSLHMKVGLREFSKKLKIPVIMATDNGDGVIADVERYDKEPDLRLFNGALGDFNLETFKSFPPQELPKLATKIAGPEFIVPRMISSLQEVGRTLYSWPQLGTAATFSGVVLAYIFRAIVTGQNLKSGKYDLNLDKFFI